ncbi:MAG: SIR2 family protein [Opitutaceae bacterium]
MTKKIVYLFGAGATHAELMALDPDLEPDENGLLISNVSKRVISRAKKNLAYIKDVELVTGTSGSLNIELYMSLIENSKIHNWADKTSLLKQLVEADITSVLKTFGSERFFLHKALLELHDHPKTKAMEDLIGLISLNYDDVLDLAYEKVHPGKINYCFSLDADPHSTINIPLLKLHGSFNWKDQYVLRKKRTIEIIPLGSSKSYLHAPYSFIWNRALDILTRCDILRVIGCSLSPNDAHLIDLLFKAHLERNESFDIQIIDSDEVGDSIKKNYGFLPGIKLLSGLGVPWKPVVGPSNPFKTWLQYTADKIIGEPDLKAMPYLKSVMS